MSLKVITYGALSVFCAMLLQRSANSEEKLSQIYSWNSAGAEDITVSVCPFKYGKQFSYSVEFDDGYSFAITHALPMLSKYFFTDAPPELAGTGAKLPLVGTVAINGMTISGQNKTNLTWEQVKELVAHGWGVSNHSYWHTGCHWDKTKMNSPAQFRRELFWNQALIGYYVFNNKRTTSGVAYPSSDYNYAPYLASFDLVHPALIASQLKNTPKDMYHTPNKTNNRRLMLDEGKWVKEPDPMYLFPQEDKLEGTLISDFTHKINTDKQSDNYKRWDDRLRKISELYGAPGKDNLWSAPVYRVIDYINMYDQAVIKLEKGKFTVTLPADIHAAGLTIKLSNVNPNSTFPKPENGCVYRKDNTVWVTLAEVGGYGAPVPQKGLYLFYDGKAEDEITFNESVNVAAIRFLQFGKPDSYPEVTLIQPDGNKTQIDYGDLKKFVKLNSRWGYWFLLPVLPEQKAIAAKGIKAAFDRSKFKKMQVWAVK